MVPSEGGDQGRLFFLLCRTEFLADVLKTFKARPSVRGTLTETSIQCKCLNFKLIEKCNSCAHLCKCFAGWCRATQTNIMAAALTEFIDQ